MKFLKLLIALFLLCSWPLFGQVAGIHGSTVGAGSVTGGGTGGSSAFGSIGTRNRLVDGDMRVDQANAGAVVAVTAGTFVGPDKWKVTNGPGTATFNMQQLAATPPAGFVNYMNVTVTAADAAPLAASVYYIVQHVEGTYIPDLGFGTASATNVTLSFWVRSSVTGTYSGAIVNGAANRSFCFTYAIASAATWQYQTVTMPVDNTGTWSTSTGLGLRLRLDLGSGSTFRQASGSWTATNMVGVTGTVQLVVTNGATFDLTGVQLEPGTSASSYELRPFTDILQQCQREYWKTFNLATAPVQNAGAGTGELQFNAAVAAVATDHGYSSFPTVMRAVPALTFFNPAAASAQVRDVTGGVDCSATAGANTTERGFRVDTTGNAATVAGNVLGVHVVADSRL